MGDKVVSFLKHASLINISSSSTPLVSQVIAVLLISNTKYLYSNHSPAFPPVTKIQLTGWSFKGKNMSHINYSFF